MSCENFVKGRERPKKHIPEYSKLLVTSSADFIPVMTVATYVRLIKAFIKPEKLSVEQITM